MVEEEDTQLCRSCAPPWLVVVSVSSSIFIVAPVLAWVMNGIQLWGASNTGTSDGLNEARDFLHIIRIMTSLVTHLQLTQLQLSIQIPWPKFLTRVMQMMTWPFTFNFNFVTSVEAFGWTNLVSPAMEVSLDSCTMAWTSGFA